MKVIHSFGTAYIAQRLRLDSCEFSSPNVQSDTNGSEADVPTDYPSISESASYSKGN